MDSERKRKAHRALLVLIGLLAFLGGLYGLYAITLGRPALSGPNYHDFGYIMIDGPAGSAEHTFRLTNRRREPVHIRAVRTSCGCTASEINRELIEPGESIEVTATMTLTSSGRRSETVTLLTEEHGARELRVEGIGRRVQQLRGSAEEVSIAPGRDGLVSLIAEVWEADPDQVPEPHIEAPQWIDWELTGWSQRRKANPRRGEPARWMGMLRLSTDRETIPGNSQVHVSLDVDGGHHLTIAVTGRD